MPQHSMEPRVFGKRVSTKRYDKKGVTICIDPAIVCSKGKMATFLVSVLFRQNASWQGTVRWVEEKKEVNFRSALELLHIINSAFPPIASNDAAIDALLDAELFQLPKSNTVGQT